LCLLVVLRDGPSQLEIVRVGREIPLEEVLVEGARHVCALEVSSKLYITPMVIEDHVDAAEQHEAAVVGGDLEHVLVVGGEDQVHHNWQHDGILVLHLHIDRAVGEQVLEPIPLLVEILNLIQLGQHAIDGHVGEAPEVVVFYVAALRGAVAPQDKRAQHLEDHTLARALRSV
jgi:hypothetical protein